MNEVKTKLMELESLIVKAEKHLIDLRRQRAALMVESEGSVLNECRSLVQANQPIKAIKLYRETFGCGLCEAKDAIDSL